MNTKTLPIGVDSFEKLIDGDYYYIDYNIISIVSGE